MAKQNKQTQAEKEKEFIVRTQEHMRGEAIKLCNEFLVKMVNEKIPYLDTHALVGRVKRIIKDKIEDVNFVNQTINTARRNHFFDTIMSAKEVHVKLHDKPDERDKRIECLAQEIADRILTPELLFSDNDYIDDAIENDDKLLLQIMTQQYTDVLYEKFLVAIQEGVRRANKVRWKKEEDEITWDDLDEEVKKGTK